MRLFKVLFLFFWLNTNLKSQNVFSKKGFTLSGSLGFEANFYQNANEHIVNEIIFFSKKEFQLNLINLGYNFNPNWGVNFHLNTRFGGGSINILEGEVNSQFPNQIVNFNNDKYSNNSSAEFSLGISYRKSLDKEASILIEYNHGLISYPVTKSFSYNTFDLASLEEKHYRYKGISKKDFYYKTSLDLSLLYLLDKLNYLQFTIGNTLIFQDYRFEKQTQTKNGLLEYEYFNYNSPAYKLRYTIGIGFFI